jgi:3-phosphoshikimate 1-carboxyvinyltransferase
LASFAKGKTVISGIRTLAVKETNRIEAIKKELSKMGIKVKTQGNSLIIYGGHPKKADINTYGDHRTAMSFALAGVKIPGIKIKDSKVVSKTYPEFWKEFEKIGVSLN